MNEISDLVNFVEASMPKIQKVWPDAYNEGFQACMDGKPRLHRTGRYGRNGMWFRGYDAAKEKLKSDHNDKTGT